MEVFCSIRFYDNFLELGFDLSKVLFIATANNLSNIQPALLDRMEIINISGYSIEEKVEITKKHLIKKQISNHGLEKYKFKISDLAIKKIIEGYTRESGVRKLDKNIAKLCRWVAKSVVKKENYPQIVKPEKIRDILGVSINPRVYENNHTAGVVTGLAWTQYGGEILFVESTISSGKGNLTLTGNLGKVMKESATIALEYIKSNAEHLEINQNIFKNYNYHLHVPEGSTPKDGPSAGVTMVTSLVSLLTQRKVKNKLAMTGEITLRGKILAVGGIKEKILAAKRAKINTIILPIDNKKNILEIDKKYLKGLTFYHVDTISEVLEKALLNQRVSNYKKL